jgi:hypothetical protein
LGVAGATSSGDNSGYRRFLGAAGGPVAGGGVVGRRGRHLGRGWPASGAGGAELGRRRQRTRSRRGRGGAGKREEDRGEEEDDAMWWRFGGSCTRRSARRVTP